MILKSERIIFFKSKRIETNKIFTKEICRLRFAYIKTLGSNQPFFLKNKNAQKRFLRLNIKELVISQAEFLVMRSMN